MDQAKHSLIMTLCDCDKDNQNAVEKGIFINGIISEWGEDNLKSILGLGQNANLNEVIGGYNKYGLKNIFKDIFNSNAHNMESIVLERHKQKINYCITCRKIAQKIHPLPRGVSRVVKRKGVKFS